MEHRKKFHCFPVCGRCLCAVLRWRLCGRGRRWHGGQSCTNRLCLFPSRPPALPRGRVRRRASYEGKDVYVGGWSGLSLSSVGIQSILASSVGLADSAATDRSLPAEVNGGNTARDPSLSFRSSATASGRRSVDI
eukprot:scaffold848_cov247-Pinguiococcus_pyrenoidosus.AAC.7